MTSWEAECYGPRLAELLQPLPLCALGPGAPDPRRRDAMESLTLESAFGGQPIVDEDMARCGLAGVWLLYDFLDESHAISQSIDTGEGSYWHGIMHRREPDYGNAKYWFRRAGPHPIHSELAASAAERSADVARSGRWSPERFVDFCQAAADPAHADHRAAQEIAMIEWRLLFDFCFQRAIGKPVS